ncbi:DnaJ-domain-containing protein [Tothia fuscella]|uniref:DnaJ-domain-containing protein n=1 Tax=Tothia fuscella TaxID=1048955 RepID=A0A9P4NQ61_9PEZI|nr:DnaJ-domain-containing protein [Tothia fuscella]
MGQKQSTSGGGQADAPIQTSYYELLGIDKTATEEEIKKAYRRKALELHPDRNYGKEEEATKLFAEIQAAYEILSDPQERAWYDSHESAILRGGTGGGASGSGTQDHYEHNVRITTAEDIAAMLGNFHGQVDYSDSATGFYGYLRDTFAKLAREEESAAEWSGEDVPEYPLFGHKADEYEDVVKEFYAGWNGFATKKTFSWLDKYRLSEAPDRRVRRMMEKENKRFRDEGVREFNDAVRTLVAFVRKRDPRYTPNTQTDEDRQKILRDASAAQAARARAANAAKMDTAIPEWTQVVDDEDGESEEEQDELEEYECVACHKTFKSEKQFEAHERSKKHQKSVQALKRQMQRDNANLHLDEDASPFSSGVATPLSIPEEDDEDNDLAKETEKNDPVPKLADLNLEDGDDDPFIDEQDPFGEEKDPFESEDDPFEPHQPIQAADFGRPLETSASDLSTEEGENDDSDYAPESAIADRLADSTNIPTSAPDSEAAVPTEPATKKLGKAAQKRLKKAAKGVQETDDGAEHKCARCNAGFSSKTKLFQHIKDLNHAAPVPVKGKSAKGKGKK